MTTSEIGVGHLSIVRRDVGSLEVDQVGDGLHAMGVVTGRARALVVDDMSLVGGEGQSRRTDELVTVMTFVAKRVRGVALGLEVDSDKIAFE